MASQIGDNEGIRLQCLGLYQGEESQEQGGKDGLAPFH